MGELLTDRFTIGVFQDLAWAERGVDALVRHGFVPASLSLLAKASPEVEAFAQRLFGTAPRRLEISQVGDSIACGPLLTVLEDEAGGELSKVGIAASARLAGFQSHDGVIFERLVARGGILMGVTTEARAADALATLHAFGGGNAAIGTWTGRV
jgi:hypothetical protein